MLKTNLLTPVLSVTLAAAVAGSGVLYVLDRKDKNSNTEADKAEKNENTVLAKVSDRISGAAATVEKAVNGESDNGYTFNADITFGEVFTDLAGTEIKPVSFKADSKIKGGKSEADLQLSYDSKSLANVYIITDNDTGTVYLKCPELGDSFLSMNPDDLAGLLKSVGGAAKLPTGSSYALPSGFGTTTAAVSGMDLLGGLGGAAQMPNLDSLKDAFKDVDLEALSKDLEEYWKVIKDTVPEGVKKEDISGDIAGHSYTYEVKSIDITLGTLKDMVTALADKAKDDQLLKDDLAKAGVTEEQYKQLIDSIVSTTNSISEQQAQQKLFSLDVYSYEGEEVGFDLSLMGMGSIKMVSINTEEVFAIDMDANFSGASAKLNGAFEMNGDAVNGSAALDVSKGTESLASVKMTAKDLVLSEDNLTGSLIVDVTADGKTVSAALDSTGTADEPAIDLGVTYNGKKAFDLKVKGEKTDASDVTVPSGNIIPLTQDGIKTFQESCDVEGFKAHIKEVLGDELYAKLTENSVAQKITQNDDVGVPADAE